MHIARCCLLAGLMMLSPALRAEIPAAAPNPEDSAPLQLAYGGRVLPPMTAPNKPAAATPPDEAASEPRQWDRALPFFAQRVIDKGYDLPNPYFVGTSFYFSREGRRLSTLRVGFNGAPLENLDFVNFPHTEIDNQSGQVLAGAFIFPFMSAYVILGHTQGTGDIDITIDGEGLMNYLNIPGCNLPPSLRPALCSQTLTPTAHAKYTGESEGVGITLAGAWRDLFFAMPVTYVIAQVTQSDTPSKTWNVAPRVGWNQHLKGGGMLTWYAGATYLKSDFNITGHFDLDTEDTVIGQPTRMDYSIHVEPENPWNWLAGGNWTINKNWSIAGEVGFGGERSNVLVTGFYRF